MFILIEEKKLINVDHIIDIQVSTSDPVPSICCKDILGNYITLYEGNTIEQCHQKLLVISDKLYGDEEVIKIMNSDYEEHFIDIIEYGDGGKTDRFRYSPQEPQLLIDQFKISIVSPKYPTSDRSSVYGIVHKTSHKEYTTSHCRYSIEKRFETFKNKIKKNPPTIDFNYMRN